MQLKHYSASTIKEYISQAVLSVAYLGKSLAQASLGEALRHLPHPINDKRAAQPYADAACSAIKVPLLEGVLAGGRALGNVFERLWRTVNYERIFLHEKAETMATRSNYMMI